MRRTLAALSLAFGLAGCAGSDAAYTQLPPGYLRDAAEIVARADWSSPDIVTVTIAGHAFSPNELVFHRDRPTRLVLVNSTDSDHAVVADQFFTDIAVERISGGGQTTRAPWVGKVVVPAGETRELWFVPARFGAYRFECPVAGHAGLGERGLIEVGR